MAELTHSRRDTLLQEYETLYAEFAEGHKTRGFPEQRLDELKRKFGEVHQAYFDGLPRVRLSRCPFSGTELRRAFDRWGPDGFWWQERMARKTDEPDPGPHFGVLQGALHLNGLPPRGGPREEAFVGPEVPFVIPRVLEQDGVVAVISRVRLACGYDAYPIAYYAKKPLPARDWTQPWTRSTYTWTEGGSPAWRVDADPWDFELEPWVKDGKVLWIDPDDPERTVRSARNGPCPFAGLEGRRERQYLLGNALRTEAPPEGEEIDLGD